MEVVRQQRHNSFLINFRILSLCFFLIYVGMVFIMAGHILQDSKNFTETDIPIAGFKPRQPEFENHIKGCYSVVKDSEFVSIGNRFFALSAYLDRREQHKTVIRVLGIKPIKSNVQLYCLIQNPTRKLQAIPASYVILDTATGNKYTSSLFECDVSTFATSTMCKVWLSFQTYLDQTAVAIPLKHLKPYINIPPQNLKVCVSPLYGVIQQQRLVEFFEVHRLFGVEYFQAYKYTGDFNSTFTNPNINQVLNLYMSKNILTVSKWSLPIPYSLIQKHAGNLAMTQCVLESYGNFKLVIVLKTDEYLVPQKHRNLNDILNLYEASTGVYCFEKYTFPACVGELLISLKSNFRIKNNQESVCVVRPEAVTYISSQQNGIFPQNNGKSPQDFESFLQDNGKSPEENKKFAHDNGKSQEHGKVAQGNGKSSQDIGKFQQSGIQITLINGWEQTNVDPKVGRVHHYKVCGKSSDCQAQTFDQTMWDYAMELEHHFNQVMDELAQYDNWE